MLANAATYAAMLLTLVAVALYAISVARSHKVTNLTNFLSAKNSQPTLRLAWCFFASGMGSWTLFSFPEIGVLAGSWGVIGYTLSCVLGFVILAVVGPYTRSMLGEGITLTDYVNNRFGRSMQVLIALISVFYQFISMVSELTCVGSLTTILSPDAHPAIPIIAVAIITNIYLLIGGLRASLATDVWQGIGVVSLLAVVCIAMFVKVEIPAGAWSSTHIAAFTTPGFETLVTLCIAVTASNMFFTGFWQRVYAANNDSTLRKACAYASAISIPFTVVLAMSGMVAHLAYPDGDYYFFLILMDMSRFWQVLVAVVVAMLASSIIDSLQLGIAAELVSNFPSLKLWHSRLICAVLNIPAIFMALKGYDILNLFLIVDVLCTATVGPMLLGMWPRATNAGALAGCAVGFLTIFVYGWVHNGSFVDGFNWFVLPEGLYSYHSMMTFIFATILPPAATVGVSLATPSKTEKSLGLDYVAA